MVQAFQRGQHQPWGQTPTRAASRARRRGPARGAWGRAALQYPWIVSNNWPLKNHHSSALKRNRPCEQASSTRSAGIDRCASWATSQVCQQLLENPLDDRFWRRIVTGDEKWIFLRNPDKRKQWVSPGQEFGVAKQDRFGKKVMLCVWWNYQGIVHFELLRDGLAVNATLYTQQLERVHEVLRTRYPGLVNRNQVLLQHDNAPAHRAKMTKAKIQELDASKFFHIQRIALTLRHLIMVCFAQWPTSSADGASTTLMPSKRAVKSFLPRNSRIGIIAKFECLRKDGWLSSIIMEFISKNKLLSFLFYPSLNKSWILSENFRDNLVSAFNKISVILLSCLYWDDK